MLRARHVSILALLLVAACAPSRGDRVRVQRGTPVVLISIDTLRSDRLPAYGYPGVETPALDSLRRDSVLFERAYTHVPLTLPSHSSMFTGLLPTRHGVRDNLGYRLDAGALPYLPRALKAEGYATGAAVSAYVLRAATGLAADFDFYDDRVQVVSNRQLGSLQRPGGETLEAALPWLESVKDRPFFFFFHIYEPHSPYDPAEPYASRYASAYDGEVAEADAIIGRLLEELRRLGIYERSLIVLLSDHGEGLGDHGEQEHEILIYREVVQVPLMVKLPDSQLGGTAREEPVQLLDVFPTLLQLLDIDPPTVLPGRALFEPSDQDPPAPVYSESFYAQLHFGWSPLTSLIEGRYQLIMGPDPELYDLLADPEQRNNIVQDERRTYGRMKATLAELESELIAPAEVDPEVRDRLAALGYIGSYAGDASGPLADPKSRLHVLRDLGEAFRHFRRQDFDGAAVAFRQVIAEEPLLTDAWEHLGKSLHRLGRYEEAIDAYQEALRLSRGSPQVAMGLAELYLEQGRLAEAREHAELATVAHEVAWDLLAQISLREDDLEAAERNSQRAVELRGTRVGPLITLAQLRLEQERLEEALELTRRAEQEFGDRPDRELLRGLNLVRGIAALQLDDLETAERAFLAEIELAPGQLTAYSHLAYLYALLDRAADSGRTLQRMVETNPTPAAYAEAVRTLRAMEDPRSAAIVLRQALQRWPADEQLRQLASPGPEG